MNNTGIKPKSQPFNSTLTGEKCHLLMNCKLCMPEIYTLTPVENAHACMIDVIFLSFWFLSH